VTRLAPPDGLSGHPVGRFIGDLTVQINQISGQQPVQQLDVVHESGLGNRWEKVGMAGDGHLGLHQQKVSLRRPIDLTLFRGGVPGMAVSNLFGYAHGRQHHPVSQRLSFPAGGAAEGPSEVTGERDAFLPDFEIAKGSCHGANMAADLTRLVPNDREECRNPALAAPGLLVINFTSAS
jgi:hypothetical protein